MNQRFQDQNYGLSHFHDLVDVVCPACAERATAKADRQQKEVRLFCLHCGYSKSAGTGVTLNGITGHYVTPAHEYFGADLWFAMPFKNEVFWAYNPEHLRYLEAYIAATLREHKTRTHFTLLEKLPRFYHEAKNRTALLRIIDRLKKK